MSPILVRPVREQLEHDRIIRLLPGRYKRRFEVGINPGAEQNAGVGAGPAAIFPDAVLYSTEKSRRIQGVVEVETVESINHLEAMSQWAPYSRLKVPFHLYVPVSALDVARRLSSDHQVIVAEIWSFDNVGDQVRFTLVHKIPDSGKPIVGIPSAPRPAPPKAAPPAPAPAPAEARPAAKAGAKAGPPKPAAASKAIEKVKAVEKPKAIEKPKIVEKPKVVEKSKVIEKSKAVEKPKAADKPKAAATRRKPPGKPKAAEKPKATEKPKAAVTGKSAAKPAPARSRPAPSAPARKAAPARKPAHAAAKSVSKTAVRRAPAPAPARGRSAAARKGTGAATRK